MAKPFISFVIPTFNRPELLAVCLQSIYSQKGEIDFEIIVVDNHPQKPAKPIVAKLKPQVVYVVEKSVGHSIAKNRGLMKARGEYCIFLDDDARLPNGWLQRAYRIAKETKATVIGGPIVPYFTHIPPGWYKARYEERSLGKVKRSLTAEEFLPTSSTVIKTEQLKQIGGFNEKYGIKGTQRRFGEDTDMLRRLRKLPGVSEFHYDHTLAIEHFTPPTKTQLTHIFAHQFNLGASDTAVSGDRIGGIRVTLKMLSVAMLAACAGLTAIIVRDKQKYPFWQNYWWERVSPAAYWVGRFVAKLTQQK